MTRYVGGIFLAANDPELARAWATFTDPVMASQDEVLEYLGTIYTGLWLHCFRHRCHPVTQDRMYWHIPARVGWEPCHRVNFQ